MPGNERLSTDNQPHPSSGNETPHIPRGNLKIFLGYVDGVGKRYAMVDAALQRKTQGVNVVIGWLDNITSTPNDSLRDPLDLVPSHTFAVGDRLVEELDLDAILDRKPELVLIDRLAHSNSPGMRHPKRYQDVAEILDAGINVYTTLNIYQLESLNDIVYQITGEKIRETLPDDFLDEANELELVDLSPEELVQRLADGRIQPPTIGSDETKAFYRKETLIALRELALRQSAGKIDEQMQRYLHTQSIIGPWPVSERLMVCISSHPMSERLVRTGRRLAANLKVEWYVVYIQTPDRLKYSAEHSAQVSHTMDLARELGAQVSVITGNTVPEAVIHFARQHNVTKIIVGKPLRTRLYEVLRSSVVNEIIRQSGSIDVYVINDETGPLKRGRLQAWQHLYKWKGYLLSTIMVILVTLFCFPLREIILPTNLDMFFLIAVVISAAYLGRGPSLLASFLSVLAFDVFITDPIFSITVSDTQYVLTFIGLLVVGLVISNFAGLVKEQVETSKRREAQTASLYALSKELTGSIEVDAIIKIVTDYISQIFSREVFLFLPGKEGLEIRASTAFIDFDESEQKVAEWAFEHRQPAGRGTSTNPTVSMRFQPLATTRGVVGVLGVHPLDPHKYLNAEQNQLLAAYASLAALAIERAQLVEQTRETQILRSTEKLQSALLNSISHDLRTPLATITGALSVLRDVEAPAPIEEKMDRETKAELVENAFGEAERLNRLVGNLLDMTRLEAGALRLNLELCDVQDLIGAAIAQIKARMDGYSIQTNIANDLPLVPMDFVLMLQVLVNLLDNAIKYSQTGTTIQITARIYSPDMLEISIRDQGIGIPPEKLDRIFDKFFRVYQQEQIKGTGLGLSISKGITEAHGGKIWAENHPEGGTIIKINLPCDVDQI